MIAYTVGYFITALLAADFLTGIYHWLEQRYAGEQWPVVGRFLMKPNSNHHGDQMAFTRLSYIERNYLPMLSSLAVAVVLLLLGVLTEWIALVLLLVSHGNEVHSWAHLKCNPIIRVIQSTGILQSPVHHSLHHKPPHLVRYCAMTNLLNPILDLAQVWRVAEATLALVGVHTKEPS